MTVLLALLCCGDKDADSGGDTPTYGTDEVYDTPPNCAITRPGDGHGFTEGDTVDFEARIFDAQDPDDALTVVWQSSVDGVLDGDQGVVDTWSRWQTDTLSPGDHVVTVTATDTAGNSRDDSVAISIASADELPTITVLHPAAGETATAGVPFALSAMVDDPQDEPPSLVVSVAGGTGPLCLGQVPDEAGLFQCEETFAVPGTFALVFTVRDPDGNSAAATTSLVVE